MSRSPSTDTIGTIAVKQNNMTRTHTEQSQQTGLRAQYRFAEEAPEYNAEGTTSKRNREKETAVALRH